VAFRGQIDYEKTVLILKIKVCTIKSWYFRSLRIYTKRKYLQSARSCHLRRPIVSDVFLMKKFLCFIL